MSQKKAVSAPSPQRPIMLLAVLLLGLCVRLIYLREISSYPNFDMPFAGSDEELNYALAQLVAGGDLLLRSGEYYFPLPLYVYVLGGFHALFGGSFWIARLFNIAMGTACIAVMFFLTRRIFRSGRVALLAALGMALYGPYIVFDTSLYKTTFELFLISLALLMLLRAAENGRPLSWLLSGLVLGLLGSVQGQSTLFILFVCLYLLASPASLRTDKTDTTIPARSMRSGIIRAGLLLSGVFIALLPVAMRNYYVTHDPFIGSSLAGINMYIGNHKGATGGFSNIEGVRPNPAGHFFDARSVAEEALGRKLSPQEVGSYWRQKACDYARYDTRDCLRLLREKMRLLLSFHELGEYGYLTSLSPLLSYLPVFSLLMPLGLAGLCLALMEYRRAWPLYACLLAYAGGMLLVFVSWRYRMPMTLALWPFGAFCIVRAGEWLYQKRLFPVCGLALLVSFFWVLGNAYPAGGVMAEKEIRRNRAGMEAVVREKALREQIRNNTDLSREEKGRLWLEIALRRYAQTDTEGAVALLRRALEDDPANPQLRRYLARMLQQPVNMETDEGKQ